MTDQPTRRSRRTTLRAIPVAVLGLLIAVLAPAPAAVAQPGTACEEPCERHVRHAAGVHDARGGAGHQAAFRRSPTPATPSIRARGRLERRVMPTASTTSRACSRMPGMR